MSLSIINTALELGLITSLVVLSLFLSYQMLNVCDLSTDGCFTFGASVGAVVAVLGHPHLSLFAALCAGAFSGLTLSVLQCYLGIDSLLAGIIINTALYSVNIAVMGNSSVINLNKTATLFTGAKDLLGNTPLDNFSRLIVIVAFVTMNAAALVRHSKRDIADSGHKILVRLKISGAPLYSFFLIRQAKHVIFIKKLLSEGKKTIKIAHFQRHGGQVCLKHSAYVHRA